MPSREWPCWVLGAGSWSTGACVWDGLGEHDEVPSLLGGAPAGITAGNDDSRHWPPAPATPEPSMGMLWPPNAMHYCRLRHTPMYVLAHIVLVPVLCLSYSLSAWGERAWRPGDFGPRTNARTHVHA